MPLPYKMSIQLLEKSQFCTFLIHSSFIQPELYQVAFTHGAILTRFGPHAEFGH